jgi:hypothetical protein
MPTVFAESKSSVELNNKWTLDKYTVSVGVGTMSDVNDFIGKYITVPANDFFYFGCTENTTKQVSYVGGYPPELHFIDSNVYPQSGVLIEDIYEQIYGLGVDEFNVFMHNKIQLFVPELSSHYDAIVRYGKLNVLLRLSTSSGADDYDIAHILVQVPHTGNFYEIVGPASSLSGKKLEKFSPWTDDECPDAHVLEKSLETYMNLYYDKAKFNILSSNWTALTGMKVPMIITISVPASSYTYIENTLNLYSELIGIPEVKNSTSTCRVYNFYAGDDGSTDDAFDDDYERSLTTAVRYVINDAAYQGSYTLSDWEQDIALTHRTYLDEDGSKWDRYLDSHIGLFNYDGYTDDVECSQLLTDFMSTLNKYEFLDGNRETEGAAHLYSGVDGLMSIQFSLGCANTDWSDVCGCISENNYNLYEEETGRACYSNT